MQKDPLKEYIKEIAKDIYNESEHTIKKEDAKLIVTELKPIINEMVSKHVKFHLLSIAQYVIGNLSSKKENSGDAKNT